MRDGGEREMIGGREIVEIEIERDNIADFAITMVVQMTGSALDILKPAGLWRSMEHLMEELLALDDLYLTGTAHAKSRWGDKVAKKWLEDARVAAFDVEQHIQLLIGEEEMNKLKKRRGESNLLSCSRYNPIPSLLISPFRNRINIRRTRELYYRISQLKQRYRSIETSTWSHPNNEPQIQVVVDQDEASTVGNDDIIQVIDQDDARSAAAAAAIDTLNRELLNASISRRSVLAIFGMRGIGKTTLVRQLYHNAQASAHFDSLAWVNITTLNKRVTIISLLKQVTPVTKKELEEMTYAQLRHRLNWTLKEKRYLIVLDDSEEWVSDIGSEDILRSLPDSNNGSRLLLISRSALEQGVVATHVSFTVPPLGHQQGWELFVKSAFPSSFTCPPDHLQDISHEFVRICGGHPHSLKLAGKLVSNCSSPNLHEWTQVLHTVTAALNGWRSYHKSLRLPALCYTDLSDNRVRSCFSYLLSLPKYKEIEASKVTGVWIALGFIPQPNNSDGDTATMEEKARVYLGELVGRSMLRVIKVDHDGSPLTFQVDPQFYDLGDEDIWWPFIFDRTRTIQIGRDPSDIEETICVRYLELRHTSSQLPSWIGDLPYLQTIDIRKTGITQLPSTLGEITTLRHLFTSSGCQVCGPINRLTNLQTLMVVDDRGGYVERDLAQLSSIRVLGITMVAEDLNLFFSALRNLKHIFSLYLQSKMPINILELTSEEAPQIKMKLPDQLQKLYLEGRVTQGLPLEPFFSKNLVVLTLDGSKLDQDPMKRLGELPKLEHLSLKHEAYVGTDMECLPGGFPRLRSLHIQCLRDLINWRMGEGSMSNLISLSIVLCDGLAMLPDELQHLTSLLELEVIDPKDDFICKLQQDGEDWHMVSHVASIKLNPRSVYDHTYGKRRPPYRIEVHRF